MSAHECFIHFIKQVGERDKMRGFSIILSLFRNKFNKFNNTRAYLLDLGFTENHKHLPTVGDNDLLDSITSPYTSPCMCLYL